MAQEPAKSMYNNPELADWLGSFEGVPDDWDQPTSTQGGAVAAIDLPWPQKLHELFASGGVLAPGVVLAVLLALVGGWLSHAVGVGLLGFDKSPISAILLAVVLGIIIRNTLGDIGERPFGLFDSAGWDQIVAATKDAAKWCLMLAMAAVGLGTNIKRIASLGLKPFVLGLCAAVLVGVVSYLLVTVIGREWLVTGG